MSPVSTEEYPTQQVNGLNLNGIDSEREPDFAAAKANAALVRDSILTGPKAPCAVHELINHQAVLHPNSPAVQFESTKPTTYGQLNALAVRITNKLAIKPKTIVPICMDVSVEFVATILAILRSGAAYCTIDPSGSLERNNGIVEDCNASMVVVNQIYAPLFGNRGMSIEGALSTESEDVSEKRQSSEVSAGDAAYLIYTSGMSTHPTIFELKALLTAASRLHGDTERCRTKPRRCKPRHRELLSAWKLSVASLLQPNFLCSATDYPCNTFQGSMHLLGQQRETCNLIARDSERYAC